VVFLDERDHPVHDHAAVVARKVVGHHLAVVYVGVAAFPGPAGFDALLGPAGRNHVGVPRGHRAGGRKGLVKTVVPRRGVVPAGADFFGLHPADVPLAEEAGAVALVFRRFGDGDFRPSQTRGVGRQDARAVGVAAGEAAGPGGVGCLEVWVAVKAHITPALVVAHDHDDVGTRRVFRGLGQRGGMQRKRREDRQPERSGRAMHGMGP